MNHSLRRLLALLAAATLVLAACGDDDSAEPTTDVTDASPGPATQTYRNEVEGFSLQVPADWLVVGSDQGSFADIADEVAGEGSDFFSDEQFQQLVAQGAVLFAVDPDGDEDFVTNVNILRFPRGPGDSAAGLLDGNVADVESVGAVVSTAEIVALPAGDAIHMQYDLEAAGLGTVTTEQYIFFTEDAIFVMTLTSREFSRVSGVVDDMADSFTVD